MKYPLNQIYFYLTNGCNLRCRHCWIDPAYEKGKVAYTSLELGLFKSIIEQARPLGLSGVKLTGGEPLLHPQLYEFLDVVRLRNLHLTMETNGVLCTRGLAGEIAKLKNPFVSVSIDGACAQTHEWVRGVKGSFASAWEGVKNLVKAGLRPQVIMTIMRRNKDEIEGLMQMADSYGAGSVKFNILQPTARGEEMHKMDEALSVEELVKLGEQVENILSKNTRLRLVFSHPLAFRPLGKIFGKTKDGCSVCRILGILGVLADGSYALCGIGETVPELIFGNAKKDSLRDIWHDAAILEEIRRDMPKKLEGICKGCLMKGLCLGGCIAQNYYTNKNLWAGFWYCEEARKRDLFPGNRIAVLAKGGRDEEKT